MREFLGVQNFYIKWPSNARVQWTSGLIEMHKKPRNTRDQTKSDLNKVSLHTFKKRILFNTSTKIVVFQAHFGK